MKFEVRNATGGQYYWRIVASNGQVLATSETYVAKQSAISACQSVKTNASGAQIVDET
jgi:uncharacterized protein YegP (UPF0339 family)